MVFGLFGGSKPTEKNIEKQRTKVKERYAQPEFRRGAMDQLLEWGTPEAYDALLSRFTVVVQSPHWDEEEKRWLVDELASRGDPAKEALVRFLKRENSVAHASQALRRLCASKEEFVSLLVEALTAREPEDHRTVQGKQELVAALGEIASGAILDHVVPYIDDHSDDVQCAAIDVVERGRVEAGYPRLTQLVTEDAHSARVLRHAAGAISRLKVPIDAAKPLAPAVIEDFVVKDGTLALNR